MRDIKFRAWNKEDSWFEYIDFTGGGEVWCNRNWLPLQQFTGLLDRNDNEIYEGDIVHFRTLGKNRMTYEVKWSDYKTGFKPTRLTQRNRDEIEVIGNRFENPELLDLITTYASNKPV